jgi:hypothetical protein
MLLFNEKMKCIKHEGLLGVEYFLYVDDNWVH